MIFGKMWRAFKAQMNKVANFVWKADPIAQLQYEYDSAVAQLKEGRLGLEQYRALVERLTRQVAGNRARVEILENKTKAYLQAGDRETAGKFVLELQAARKDLSENEEQLRMHEEAYNNNLEKVKAASEKIARLRERIQKYDADLKMSKAEAEMARLAQSFNMDVTTDFGEIEQVIQDKISLNKAKARVAADLSGEGLADLKREKEMEKVLADQALRQFELEIGMAQSETVQVTNATAHPERQLTP